jgi:type III pantothenate kinase
MNTLCIDIGNTNTKVGIFSEGKLIEKQLLKDTMDATHTDALIRNFHISRAILSATRNFTEDLEMILEKLPIFFKLSNHLILPFTNNYTTPETLGRDRLAVVAAVHCLHPQSNVLAIDAGTCITMDAVDAEGNYLGGSIHPGLHMRLKAMHHFTGKLPEVKLREYNLLWGTNSETSVLAGGIYGAIIEIDAIITQYRSYYDNLLVYITGGDMEYFVNNLKNKIFAHPDLVLQGLYEILECNAKK